MELEFTADQEHLRETVRAVLEKECPIELVRERVERGTEPERLWEQMVELGWPALTVAEEHGGLGLGFVELAVVVEELGRVAAPGPYLPTVTQFAPLVREVGLPAQQERFLGAVAAGEITATVAVAEAEGSFDPHRVTATAELLPDGGVRLHGTKRYVVEAAGAQEIGVVARLEGTHDHVGLTAAVVPASDVRVTPLDGFDRSRPLATVDLADVHVPRDRVLGEPGAAGPAIRRALEEATVALALETVGTCQTMFDITLEYAKQREQFGVPIGSFQAVKHKLADAFVALERARAVAYFAALTIADDDERREAAVSVAKAAAGDCQRVLAKEGIQLHGGIGFTWEHDMQLYVKRVKANDALFGNAPTHRARLADLLGV